MHLVKTLLNIAFLSLISFVVNAETIKIYTWEDYISPEVIRLFEEQTGNTVNQIYFDSEVLRDEVVNTERAYSYDLIILDSLTLEMMSKQNQLTIFDPTSLPTLKNMDSISRRLCGNTGVPYMWGTMGIAYRKSKYPNGVTSWMSALTPSPEHKGKITIPVDEVDTTAMALLALHYDPFTSDKAQLMEAFNLLKATKQNIKEFVNALTYAGEHKEKTDLDLVVAFSGESYSLKQLTGQDDWTYIMPEEGTLIWQECFAQLKDTPLKPATIEFLNFINDPKIAAMNAEYVWYATSNKESMKYVSDEYKDNSELFPSKQVLEQSYSYKNIDLEGLKLRTRIISILTNDNQ